MRTSSPLSTILESIQFLVLRVVRPFADRHAPRSSKETESFFVEYCNIRFLYVSILLLKYNFGCKDNIKTAIAFVYKQIKKNIKQLHDVPQTICLNQANAASISLIGFYSLLVCFWYNHHVWYAFVCAHTFLVELQVNDLFSTCPLPQLKPYGFFLICCLFCIHIMLCCVISGAKVTKLIPSVAKTSNKTSKKMRI